MITPEEIRKLREKIGATQGDFAKALGISFSTVSRWESGKSEPTDIQEEQLVALKQLIDDQKINIDKRKIRKLLTLMGIGGVIATATIAGLKISNPLGAAISSTVGRVSATSALLKLFKKDKKNN